MNYHSFDQNGHYCPRCHQGPVTCTMEDGVCDREGMCDDCVVVKTEEDSLAYGFEEEDLPRLIDDLDIENAPDPEDYQEWNELVTPSIKVILRDAIDGEGCCQDGFYHEEDFLQIIDSHIFSSV